MAKKNNTNTTTPSPVDLDFDFGVEVSDVQSFLNRSHGGGGTRSLTPLSDPAAVPFAEWIREWVGSRNGDASACKTAIMDGTEWPTTDSKYSDRGVFLGRFAKPSSAVARGKSNGEGPIVIETKGGNVKAVGYWSFRLPGHDDVAVVEETVVHGDKETVRSVRHVKADTYTVGVRLALASGEAYAVAAVSDGQFVTPATIDKATMVKVG